MAIALEKLGLSVFIDSCAWGYVGDLLKKIDNDHCWNEDKKLYSYELRNQSTAHVYTILHLALQRMIDSSELLLFLSTNESIPLSDYISSAQKTYSPWISSELMFSSLVRRKYPEKNDFFVSPPIAEAAHDDFGFENLTMLHEAKTKHLHPKTLSELSRFILNELEEKSDSKIHALNAMYKKFRINDQILDVQANTLNSANKFG